MATEVFIAKATDFMEVGVLVAWLVKEGDQVAEGQGILEVETDKAIVEMGSPASGFLKGIRPGAVAGATIPVGETIAYIVADMDEPVAALDPL